MVVQQGAVQGGGVHGSPVTGWIRSSSDPIVCRIGTNLTGLLGSLCPLFHHISYLNINISNKKKNYF